MLEALARRWWFVLLFALLGAAGGYFYADEQDPTYSAEARLSVGRVDVATQSIPGFNQAALTLADTYSRAILANRVLSEVSDRSGISPRELTGMLSASPVPESPVLDVSAETTESPQAAISLANDSARALVSYVRDLNTFNPQSDELLEQYREASVRYEALRAESRKTGSPEDAADAAEAKLERDTFGGLYSSSQSGQSSPNTLQVLAKAVDASDDRTSIIQRAALAGAGAGLIVGALLALVWVRISHWRRLRRS